MKRYLEKALAGATVLASLVLCLLVIEVGLRQWDGIPVFSTVNFVGQAIEHMHNPSNGGAEYDSVLGWVQRPNKSFPGFTTGQYGVRMPTSAAVPLQQQAVLVVGDSFAVGSDVTDAESWPAQLEAALGTQVINAGVGGYALDQTILRAEQLVPALHPKLLIVQSQLRFTDLVNRMSMRNGILKPYFKVRDGELVPHNSPVPRNFTAMGDIGGLRSVFGHSYLVYFTMTRLNLLGWWIASSLGDKVVLSEQEGLDVTCLLLRRAKNLGEQHHLNVLVLFQYGALEAMEEPLSWQAHRARYLACARQEKLDVIDGLDVLRSAFRTGNLTEYQNLWVMQDHNRAYGHMSAQGNRLIVDLILKRLQGAEGLTNVEDVSLQKSK